MKKIRLIIGICIALIVCITASLVIKKVTMGKSSEIVLGNDNTNQERNKLLKEDIKYFKKELPKRHKNLFANITEKEFNDRTNKLIEEIDQLSNTQVFIELNKIIAAVGDAHTSINYWDGFSYPLQLQMIDGNVYVVNADTSLEGMMYSKVVKIDGIDINIVTQKLKSLISHENDSWVLSMLPYYIQFPVYMNGLGIIKDEKKAVFTVQKDGKEQKFTVSPLKYGEKPNYVNQKTEDVLIGYYDKYYSYKYLPGEKALYFAYNVCADMDNQKFTDFNTEMFDVIEKNNVDKVIVDLRNNSGGNSNILDPFTKRLKSYIAITANVKVYILIGRNTFSSGMFAIYGIKESAPNAITVGEPTGGALDCYGEVKTVKLPNSQIPISYSTKYFEFSKLFSYKNNGVGTFLPDITIQPTIDDIKSGTDVALNYALSN